MAKMRLDVLLVEQGLFPSREQARTAIMSRKVSVDGQIVDKAGAQVSPEAELRMVAPVREAVERWEPRVIVTEVTFEADANGHLKAKVVIANAR